MQALRRTTILLADNHTMICDLLRKMLEPEFEVIAHVEDGHALIKAAVERKPDLVLAEVEMPLLNDLDATRVLKKLMPRLKVIFLTMNPDPIVASEALKIGASGYLLKNSEGEAQLLKAVRSAVRGTSYVTPQIRQAMEERFIRDPKSLRLHTPLSDRQRDVLQMLVGGRRGKEVAEVLHITHRTVRYHKHMIMEEFGINTYAELVQFAVKHSILPPM